MDTFNVLGLLLLEGLQRISFNDITRDKDMDCFHLKSALIQASTVMNVKIDLNYIKTI